MRNRPQNKRRDQGGRRYFKRPSVCRFCADKSFSIDYKNKALLGSFVGYGSKIRPRRQTGTCARHQRKLAVAIKRARHMAILPFSGELLR